VGIVDRALASALPVVPRSIVRRVSAPYIAGPTLEDAHRAVVSLNAEAKSATIDVLGEEIHSAAEAQAIAAAYADVLAAIDTGDLDANVSVKLTGLGLKLDLDLCRSLLEDLVRDARARGSFVRIDMEDATCVDDTLALYCGLRGSGSTT
jgi:proline dehydrogenase